MAQALAVLLSEEAKLQKHFIFSTELPREMQGILACCNPIPPLVKQNLNEIHEIILKAREQPMTSFSSDGVVSMDGSDTNVTFKKPKINYY